MSIFEHTSEQDYITSKDIEALSKLILLERRLGVGRSIRLKDLYDYNFNPEEISGLMYVMKWETESFDLESCN